MAIHLLARANVGVAFDRVYGDLVNIGSGLLLAAAARQSRCDTPDSVGGFLQGFHNITYLVRVADKSAHGVMYGMHLCCQTLAHLLDVGLENNHQLPELAQFVVQPIGRGSKRRHLGNERLTQACNLVVRPTELHAKRVHIAAHRLDRGPHAGDLVTQRLDHRGRSFHPRPQRIELPLSLARDLADYRRCIRYPMQVFERARGQARRKQQPVDQ
jgi:hypothetical protein